MAAVLLRATPLGAEIAAFGRWFEDTVPLDGSEAVGFVLGPAGLSLANAPDELAVARWPRLRKLLAAIGVRELELDPRLECNQIIDVLTVLVSERRSLGHRGRRQRQRFAVRALLADGLELACTVTRLESQRLTISYSYCMTRFSRLVTWFKRQSRLGDHRALFRAAPRFAALVSLGPLAMFGLYSIHDSWWLLLIGSVLGSSLLFAATYVIFMTVGSVEYDNEEKAHILRQAYDRLKLYADRIRDDMDRARIVQQRLLPDLGAMPLSDSVEWAASFAPQEEVGGDYFDAAVTARGRMALVFADVSGHGLGASLVTAIIKTTFEYWLERDDGLSDLVRVLNQRLIDLTPPQSFAAVVVGLFNPHDRTLTYCNCGHFPHPYLVPADDGGPRPLDAAQAPILGVLPGVDPRPAVIEMHRGDTLFLATDGLVEAENGSGIEFGLDRLYRFLETSNGTSLEDVVTHLVERVDRHTGGREACDDRTVLAMRLR